MKKSENQKFQEWAASISEDQAKEILIQMFDFCLIAEFVGFGDFAPYYKGDGEPLIEGQIVWSQE